MATQTIFDQVRLGLINPTLSTVLVSAAIEQYRQQPGLVKGGQHSCADTNHR